VSLKQLDLRIEARRENLHEEAIFTHHAFTGGPLLQQGAAEQPQRDRSRYEEMKERNRGWWLN
jgi:hypothetical protein